eukprot:GHVL01013947.1.p1 GENE.GHVL01013947.1~~GHVL01013947.1.p1  ORF type:complete len:174 (+),score=13.41 GHVL01013947.1:126-647(+)
MPGSLPAISYEGGKFRHYNQRKINAADLKKLAPQQRSRYLAYEDPPSHVAEAQHSTMRRLRDLKRDLLNRQTETPREEEVERDKHARLIGQLKAAEARNRLRIMRLRYQANRAQEIGHLIACQPVALKAVRLQALVPPYPDTKDKGDQLDKLDRVRVESLIEDTNDLLVNRSY